MKESFESRFELLRKTLQLTFQEFGDKIGRHKATVYNYEKGIRKPDNTTIQKYI